MPTQQQGSSMSKTRPSQRFHSLNSEQVEVLDQVLSEVVPIHGRGNFPTLELRPRDIVIAVRAKLLKQGISVRDVRLNGSTASHVLVRDNGTSYKDLDIIFGVELPRQEDFQVIKESVLGCLLDCLPVGVNRERISSATMKEAYVQKMVKVFTEQDRWSLISLSNNSGKNLELKFVSVLRRQFEFSVDSFQIILDPLLESYQRLTAKQEASVLEREGQASGNQKKDVVPQSETLESVAEGMASNEATHTSQGQNKNETEDTNEKEPQTELSQQGALSSHNQHSEPEKHEKVTTQTEQSDEREHIKKDEHTKQKKVSGLDNLSEQTVHSEHSEPLKQKEQLKNKEPSEQKVEQNVELKQHSEQKEYTEQKDVFELKKCSEEEKVLEQTNHTEQQEPLKQAHHSDQTGSMDKTEPLDPDKQTGCLEQIENVQQAQHSVDGEQTNQIGHSHHKGLINQKELSAQKELFEHTEPLSPQAELIKQIAISEQGEQSFPSQKDPVNPAEHLQNKERSHEAAVLKYSNESQGHKKEDKSHTECVSDTGICPCPEPDANSHLATEKVAETETEPEAQTESKNDPEPTVEQIAVTDAEQPGNVDKCSSPQFCAFPADITQPTGQQHTPETQNTLPTENSESRPDAMDTATPQNPQDKLLSQSSLVSDKKTPCYPPGKAPSRLSQMVVLKHSSPKPPRRMCRKVTPNPNPISVPEPEPEPEPSTAPILDPDPGSSHSLEPEITTKTELGPMPKLAVPPSVVNIPTKTDPSPNTSLSPDTNLPSKVELISTPNPPTDMSVSPVSTVDPNPASPLQLSTSCLMAESPAEIVNPNLTEVQPTCLAVDTESHLDSCSSAPEKTASPFKQSEPPDSADTLVSHTDTPEKQICSSTCTSEAELSDDGDEEQELQEKMMGLDLPPSSPTPVAPLAASSLPGPFPSSAPTAPCLAPLRLNPSPQASRFPSSSPSLSPPQCFTPPSHCLTPPVLSISPPPSYSPPPLSFSPASSCLSSPPYLTPMLSLSPPPHCLSPPSPSPSLSPPLLCLTPPAEPEELIPQVSSDPQPLIQNTESGGKIMESSPQPADRLLHSQDKDGTDMISSLPQVSEPVSFPATTQSPGSDMPPLPQPGEKLVNAPTKAPEVSSTVPENKDTAKVSTDIPEQNKALQASSTVLTVKVFAESMYGDFEAAMDHLRYRLIATRNPEEIRGGGLLKYSNLLVRDYRPASETQIKTLERYMCSRFFIDFPDVQEQQRKILSYLKNHFIGEERSKYQYLMTLRRVVDDSTVCLMGHERRQTLNMITVLALKVLGEQNIIPNTDHVTCFYQPAPYLADHSAPYLAEPSYCSYYIPHGGSTLLYQPYPLHLHTQTGLV